MKITKITKFLPIALALSLSIGCVQASTIDGTDESTSAVLNYQLELNDYIQVTATELNTMTSEGTFDANYANLELTSPMAGGFKVISNKESRVLKLTASNTTTAAGMGVFADNKFNLVFTNEDATGGTTTGAVENITGGSPQVDLNPNAIAFEVTVTPGHTGGPTESPLTAAWVTDHVEYTMKNGVATIDFQLNDKAEAGTFSTHDTQGTYKATLTLTDESHT